MIQSRGEFDALRCCSAPIEDEDDDENENEGRAFSHPLRPSRMIPNDLERPLSQSLSGFDPVPG